MSTVFAADDRLAELFAGHGAQADTCPAPCPASCRPQAWAAASAVMVLQAALGLEADVPGGKITTVPTFAQAYGPLTLKGLRVADMPLQITIKADGTASVLASEALTVFHERS